ncbi:MAG: hypothetical protein ACLR7Z_01670 [Bilophila wadsworthia]
MRSTGRSSGFSAAFRRKGCTRLPEGPGTGRRRGLSCAPACTCVGVAALPNPAAVVEVELEGFAG